jgi:hypothetical protein
LSDYFHIPVSLPQDERDPPPFNTHWTGGWEGSRADLATEVAEPGMEPRLLRGAQLYWLTSTKENISNKMNLPYDTHISTF